MEKKNKGLYWMIFIVGMIAVTVFTIIFIITMKQELNKDDLLEDKVDEEVSYLDSTIISVMNTINNISTNNYILESKENSNEQDKKSSSNEEQASSEEENTGKQSGSSESNSSSGSNSGSGSNSESSQENNIIYQMQRSGVLTGKDIDWQDIQNSIENIYPTWTTVEVDLDKMNVSNDTLKEFNNTLDETIIDVKAKDKTKTVMDLGSLYGTLTKIVNEYSKNEGETNKYNLKSNVIENYVLVEQDNWQEAKNKMNDINKSYNELKLNSNNKENNDETLREYNLIKIDKLISDLQSVLEKQSKDLYYIKYKMLIEELNLI